MADIVQLAGPQTDNLDTRVRPPLSATKLFWVDTGYACAGVVCSAGQVIEAAPIYRWMVGRSMAEVERDLRRRCRRLVIKQLSKSSST